MTAEDTTTTTKTGKKTRTRKTKEEKPTTETVVAPAPVPAPTPVAAEKDGKDGKDGKKEKTVRHTAKVTFDVVFKTPEGVKAPNEAGIARFVREMLACGWKHRDENCPEDEAEGEHKKKHPGCELLRLEESGTAFRSVKAEYPNKG